MSTARSRAGRSRRTGAADVEDLWEPLVVPDGGPGRFPALLTAAERAQIRDGLVGRLGHPSGPFSLIARAWSVRGAAPA